MGGKLAIMFLSEKNGKSFSGKIGFLTLTVILVLLVCLIGTTTVSFTRYISIHRQNGEFKELMNKLDGAIKRLKVENREAILYKQWADKIIFKRLHFEDMTGKGDNTIAENTLVGEIKDDPSTPSRSFFNIDDFEISRINLALDFNFSFKLLNRTQGRKLSGYIFVVASNNDVIPQACDSWPRTDFLSGMPKDFKKGDGFFIRYMKRIRGRIEQPDIGPKFNRVDLIAFSEDGNLLMKKGFYIERLLQESPFE